MKRVVSYILVIILMCSFCITPSSAAGNSESEVYNDSMAELIYERTDFGYVVRYTAPEAFSQTDGVGTPELMGGVQLDTPQNLTWNYDEYGNYFTGFITWDVVENCGGEYLLTVYRDGDVFDTKNCSELYSYGETNRVGFYYAIFINESDTYTFTVKAIGDGENYLNSDVSALSPELIYTRPSEQLGTPDSLIWNGSLCQYNSVAGAGGYYHRLYYQAPGDSEPSLCGAMWDCKNFAVSESNGEARSFDFSVYFPNMGGGTFYYDVCALSPDIYLTATGGWSAMSGGYNYEAEPISGTCGANLIWELDTITGALSISGTGEMYDYFYPESAPWGAYNERIISASIGDGVESIGERAFYNCYGLTSVSIPASVRSIGEAFGNCLSLRSIEIPEGVLSIGAYAFDHCSSLINVSIPASVTNIGSGAFSGCSSLMSITANNANTDYSTEDGVLFNVDKTTLIQCPGGKSGAYTVPWSVTNIDNSAFWGCGSLTGIDIPVAVESIGLNAFSDCIGLTSIDIPYGVTSIKGSTFRNCSNLTSIGIPLTVTSINDEVFSNCNMLTDAYFGGCESDWNAIDIGSGNECLTNAMIHYGTASYSGMCGDNLTWTLDPDIYVLSISGTGAMYDYDDYSPWYTYSNIITDVDISYGATSIGDNAFSGCSSVPSIDIPSSVEGIGDYAFYGCSSQTSIDIPMGVTSIGEGSFEGCIGLTSIDIPSSVESVGAYAFYGLENLTNICIYSSLTSIGEGSFEGCTSLASIDIVGGISSIGEGAFKYCVAVTSIEIPTGLTSIGEGAFEGCIELTSIGIPMGLTSIGAYAFYGCEQLESVDIPTGVTGIGDYTFYGCDRLKSVSLPAGVTSIGAYAFYECQLESVDIPAGVTSIGAYAFYECCQLESVDIPAGVTSIGDYTFYACGNLTSVSIPSSVESIGEGAFSYCERLCSIDIPEGVTSIGAQAFRHCQMMNIIELPYTVTSIGEGAFHYCYDLLDVDYGGSENDWNAIDIAADNWCLTDALIHFSDTVCNLTCELVRYWNFDTEEWVYTGDMVINGTGPMTSSFLDGLPRMCPDGTDIKNIDISYGATSIGDCAFWCCSSLTSVSIPSSVKSIGESAFFGCSSLTSVSIPSSVTTIRCFAFSDCSSLASVSIPSSVTRIDSGAFLECSSLTSVNIPSGVERIEASTFIGCSSLRKISIPSSVTEIHAWAFDGCDKLSDVYYSGSEDDWDGIEKQIDNEDLTDATIHYYSSGSVFTINFNLNYEGGGTYNTQSVTNGLNIVQPAKPSRDGYRFYGWYATDKCIGIEFFSSNNEAQRQNLSGDITLYAKWVVDSSGLDPSADVFSFTNSGSNFCISNYDLLIDLQKAFFHYDISDSDYETLISEASNIEKTLIKDCKDRPWGGSCFGMSAVVCLAQAGLVSPENYEVMAKSVSALDLTYNTKGDKDVGKVESLINYYQFLQNMVRIREIRNTYSRDSESSNLESIVQKMQSSNDPIVLLISMKNENGSTVAGHAVVGYDMRYNSEEKAYTIKIYDCSIETSESSGSYTLTIKENNGIYEKECGAWEYKWKEAKGYEFFFSGAITVDELKKEIILTSASLMDAESTAYGLTTNYDAFTITDGTASAVITDGEVSSGDLDVVCYGPQNEPDAELSMLFDLPSLNAGESYVITPSYEDGNYTYDTLLNFNDASDGFFASVSADDMVNVTVSAAGKITTSYPTATAQTIGSALNSAAAPWYYVEMSGTDTGFTVTPSSGETGISSVNSASVSVTVEEDINTLTFTDVAVDSVGISVMETTGRVCAIEKDSVPVMTGAFGYSIVFNSMYGSAVESLYGVAEGSTISEPAEPERMGYLFDGWYKEDGCVNEWNFGTDTVTGDTILYAAWTADTDFVVSVTFRANGCNDQIVYLSRGSGISAEEIPDLPEREGFTSLGWEEIDLSSVEEDIIVNGIYTGIADVVMNGMTATVTFENAEDCILVVAVYNADGKMIGIGSENMQTAAGTAEIELSLSSLPEIYVVKAYLFNSSGAPLCTNYDRSPN